MRKFGLLFLLSAVLSHSAFAATAESGPPKLVLNPSGTGAGATGELKFKELVANGQHSIIFKAPDALAGNVIYTFPNADGTGGYVLSTDGSGNLSWIPAGSGGISDGDKGDITVSGTGTALTIDTDVVTNAKLADAAALSVKGNATNSPDNPTDIAAGSDHQVLRRSGTAIGFGALALAQSAATTGELPPNRGGTGLNTITAGGVMYGNGTSNVVATSAPTSGQILLGNTTTPAFVTMGTDATITNTGALTIANNAITTVKITDANVTTAKIADANVTYAKHSAEAITSLQRKNLVINPRFDVWQRGTSFSTMSTGTYSADRIKYLKGGTMVHTVARDTDVPTVAQAGVLANYSFYVDCTTAQGSLSAGDAAAFRTTIEGYDYAHIAQRAFTLSFWVKATKTGTHCVAFYNTNGDRTYVGEYTATAGWTKATINVSASPSSGTWNYTNGEGLNICWCLGAGTTFTSGVTAGSWLSGTGYTIRATSNQVNDCDSTSNDFRIALVQIEAGDNATPFEFRPAQQEMALCQRYCVQWTAGGAGLYIGSWRSESSSTGYAMITLPVPMRDVPGASVLDAASIGAYDGSGPSATITTNYFSTGGPTGMLLLTAGSATWTAHRAGYVFINSGKWIRFDADY